MKKTLIALSMALLMSGMMTACSSGEDEFDVEQVSQHCARYWAIGSILVLLTTVNLVVFSNLLARWSVGLSTTLQMIASIRNGMLALMG